MLKEFKTSYIKGKKIEINRKEYFKHIIFQN